MTTSSPSGGPRPEGTPPPGTDEEPLPAASSPATDETPLVRLASGPSAPDGRSFSAGFARRHHFSGARLLRPGRRVVIAVAGVTGLAVVGVGVVAGVSRLGGDETAQAAATVEATDRASGPAAHDPSASPGKASHRPSGSAAHHSGSASGEKKGGSSAAGGAAPAEQPAAPETGGGGGKSTGQATGSGTGSSGHTATQKPKSDGQAAAFTGGLVLNFASNRCLASQGGSKAAGTPAVLADCDDGDPSQGWTFPSDGTARTFGGTMCLAVSGHSDGTTARLAACSSSRADHQSFTLKKSFDLVDSVDPDLCLDVTDKNTAAGTVLQLWSCAGTSNQKWRMA
ncbi:ricin-type beta-trefoil lectin domain protein [Streptomyces sp. cg28]|uniref:ricin-type beta-trefoil lectin domain protein n=1 Tax=Streptomyces sp. cg28 TaxID=3403457 RepID=UPI003B21BB34